MENEDKEFNKSEEDRMEQEVDEIDEDDEFDDEETSRDLVVPGEILTEDVKNFIPGRGTILSNNKIISLHIGLKNIKKNYINVIPLRGIYTPQPGDKVIAIVVDKNPVKYKCDINAKDFAQLKPRNTVKRIKGRMGGDRGGGDRGGGRRSYDQEENSTTRFNIGDVLIVKVLSADRINKPELTTIGKYLGIKNGGIVISIDPPKIPRVIGRSGSMIKMLKNLTNTNIFVTQNGRIWLRGDNLANERLLIEAIYKIQREAHTSGLTDRVQAFIENEKIKRGIK